jgi:glucose-1-phosphate adenylyltransferase
MDNCDIGRHSKLRRVILDKNVKVAADTSIGYDRAADAARYFVTESGIVVINGERSPVEISGLVV